MLKEETRWRRIFLPTVLAIVGTFSNPWVSLPVAPVQAAWDIVYGPKNRYGRAFVWTFVKDDTLHKLVRILTLSIPIYFAIHLSP